MALTVKNNIALYKTHFKTDTGKNWDEDLSVFMAYCTVRCLDGVQQVLALIKEDVDLIHREMCKPKR